MTFERYLPTVPGLYWYKKTKNSKIAFSRIWWRSFNGELVATFGATSKRINSLNFFWSTEFLPEPKTCLVSEAAPGPSPNCHSRA
jgi:hypothetical protein